MHITDNLYVFFFYTHMPNTAAPTNPPIMKTAPSIPESSYYIWNKQINFTELYEYLLAIYPTMVPRVLKTP